MRVLTLTLRKIFFCKFFHYFQLPVWNVRTDLFLSLDACGSVNLWFGSMPSGRVCTTFKREPFAFFAIRTALHFFLIFVMLCVSLTDFSRDFGILCTSLLIQWYSLCLFLCSFKFLCFLEYWNNCWFEYFSWDIVHENPILSMLGWYWYIWVIWIAIFAYVFLASNWQSS